MGDYDLRDGESNLPFTAGFYLEWEKWAAEDLVDGLVTYALFPDGLHLAQKMREVAQKPECLMRKYSVWQGKFAEPQSLEGYQREIEAIRNGALDGYALHLMFVAKHEFAQPDWRDLLAVD